MRRLRLAVERKAALGPLVHVARYSRSAVCSSALLNRQKGYRARKSASYTPYQTSSGKHPMVITDLAPKHEPEVTHVSIYRINGAWQVSS